MNEKPTALTVPPEFSDPRARSEAIAQFTYKYIEQGIEVYKGIMHDPSFAGMGHPAVDFPNLSFFDSLQKPDTERAVSTQLIEEATAPLFSLMNNASLKFLRGVMAKVSLQAINEYLKSPRDAALGNKLRERLPTLRMFQNYAQNKYKDVFLVTPFAQLADSALFFVQIRDSVFALAQKYHEQATAFDNEKRSLAIQKDEALEGRRQFETLQPETAVNLTLLQQMYYEQGQSPDSDTALAIVDEQILATQDLAHYAMQTSAHADIAASVDARMIEIDQKRNAKLIAEQVVMAKHLQMTQFTATFGAHCALFIRSAYEWNAAPGNVAAFTKFVMVQQSFKEKMEELLTMATERTTVITNAPEQITDTKELTG